MALLVDLEKLLIICLLEPLQCSGQGAPGQGFPGLIKMCGWLIISKGGFSWP